MVNDYCISIYAKTSGKDYHARVGSWHRRPFYRGIYALVSRFRDGDIAEKFLLSLGYRVIRGSTEEGKPQKGGIIGMTGNTGFALGDHLHFGIVVQGYEVNPIEWLDPKWVKNSIISVFEAR